MRAHRRVLAVCLLALAAGCAEREATAPSQRNVDQADGGAFAVRAEELAFHDGAAPGFLAQPAPAGDYPGVVMVHEWWGLNDEIREMAKRLASHGYHVLAVDLFGAVATTPEEARAQVAALDQAEATATMRAAADALRERGATGIASLGWCFGGGQSLQLALSGEPLTATVIFYGRLDTDPANLSAIDWPVLGIFGAEDQSIPVAQVDAFEDALDQAGVPNEIHVYNGVGHAFANPSGDAYAPGPAQNAWDKTLAFLAAHARGT